MTRCRGWLVAFGLGLLSAGCGGPQLATVEGVVTLDSKPLADVEVQFLPDPSRGTNGPPASTYTDAQGRYRVAASKATGVLVGTHRVCLHDATLMMPGGNQPGVDPATGEPAAGGRAPGRTPRVPAIYSDSVRTPYSAIEVRAGTQTLNFELKARP